MTSSPRPLILAEDDPFIRIVQVVLDPETSAERLAAFADFFAHDLPDFDGWRRKVQQAAAGLYPAEVRMVESQVELRAGLPDARAVIVESLEMGAAELALAPRLAVVQKYGTILRGIDTAACAARDTPVLTLRRRANVACAEHTLASMLVLAKKLNTITGIISYEQLEALGHHPQPFDRRHTANSGWARISGLQMLYESTLGIIGFGEIGRELALRAAAFGMRVLYYQRTRLPEAEEQRLHATYAPLEQLLAESDWVSLQLPRGAGTRDFLNRERLAMMKPGACLINTAQADQVERGALIDALRSGRLAGFALDPLYEEPGRAGDELLTLPNVLMTPHTAAQPRFNALRDMEDLIGGIAAAVGTHTRPTGGR